MCSLHRAGDFDQKVIVHLAIIKKSVITVQAPEIIVILAKITANNTNKETHNTNNNPNNEKTSPTSTSAQCPSSRPPQDLIGTPEQRHQQIQSRTETPTIGIVGTATLEETILGSL